MAVSVFRQQAATVATDNSILIWDLSSGGGIGGGNGADGEAVGSGKTAAATADASGYHESAC